MAHSVAVVHWLANTVRILQKKVRDLEAAVQTTPRDAVCIRRPISLFDSLFGDEGKATMHKLCGEQYSAGFVDLIPAEFVFELAENLEPSQISRDEVMISGPDDLGAKCEARQTYRDDDSVAEFLKELDAQSGCSRSSFLSCEAHIEEHSSNPVITNTTETPISAVQIDWLVALRGGIVKMKHYSFKQDQVDPVGALQVATKHAEDYRRGHADLASALQTDLQDGPELVQRLDAILRDACRRVTFPLPLGLDTEAAYAIRRTISVQALELLAEGGALEEMLDSGDSVDTFTCTLATTTEGLIHSRGFMRAWKSDAFDAAGYADIIERALWEAYTDPDPDSYSDS